MSSHASSDAFSDVTKETDLWEPPVDYDCMTTEYDSVPRRRERFSSPKYNRQNHDHDSNSEEDVEGNPKTFKRVCVKFAERTSMQGVPYVHVSAAKYAKALWVLIFLAGCVCMSLHLYLLVDDFYAYETKTQVDLGFSPLTFPAVTLCNVNRIRKSKLELASSELRQLVADFQPSNIASSIADNRKIKDAVGPSNQEDGSDNNQQQQPSQQPTQSDLPSMSAPSSDPGQPPTSSGSSGSSGSGTSLTSASGSESSSMSESGTTSNSGTASSSVSGSTADTSSGSSSGSETGSGTSVLGSTDTSSSGSTDIESSQPPSGSTNTGSTDTGSDQPSSSGFAPSGPPAGGKNKKRKKRKKRAAGLYEAANEVLEGLAVRVKRYIPGFEVNETYGEPDSASSQDTSLGNKSVSRQIDNQLTFLYSVENRATRVAMGHQLDEMLVSCSFAGHDCYARNFKLLQTAEYGNCYTLDESRFVSINGGPKDGFELVVYLDHQEYQAGVTSAGASLQVIIHEPDSMPFPYRKGFAVSAAHENNIGLRLINVFRESEPYGDCQTTEDEDLTAAGLKYTKQACSVLCLQRQVFARCGCYDAANEEINLRVFQVHNNTAIRFCKTSDEVVCVSGVESDYLKGDSFECDCHNPCSESEYSKTLSFRSWPSDDYAVLLAQQLCELNETNCDVFLDTPASDLRENFIKLNIYFEDLNYEDIREMPDYEITQFISDVGGTIGLWIGLSIISFFEVLQFLYEVFQFLVFHKPRQKAKTARRTKLKQRLTETAAVAGRVQMSKKRAVDAFTGGLTPKGLRPMSTMDSPKGFHSFY